MINSGNIAYRETGIAVTSAGVTREGGQSEFSLYHSFMAQISAPASLVGGILRIEEFDPLTNAWVTAHQIITLLATGGGTPAGQDKNTAAATMLVNGVIENQTGLITITNTATVLLQAPGSGKRVRLFCGCSSGTATLAMQYTGQRVFT